eukprot:m.281801 g.281801  ORF g.281801 m.281801 type:complete len:50 (+) comp17743_c0_seq7:1267-1416(+)
MEVEAGVDEDTEADRELEAGKEVLVGIDGGIEVGLVVRQVCRLVQDQAL